MIFTKKRNTTKDKTRRAFTNVSSKRINPHRGRRRHQLRDYELAAKAKKSDFEHRGDLYKVKTFKEITKLERNGLFVYESVPGTAVTDLNVFDDGMTFKVEGPEDAQITVEMEAETEYKVLLDGVNVGHMTTNLGGKLSFSVELEKAEDVAVEIVKA